MKKTTLSLLLWSLTTILYAQVMTSQVEVSTDYTDKTEILNSLKVHGGVEALVIKSDRIETSGHTLNIDGNAPGLYVRIGTNNAEKDFILWTGGSSNTRHMRIGTDVGHYGDAAMEIYQNSHGNPTDPGRVKVNGDLRTGKKIYFGGEDESSYLMHIDGSAGANASTSFNIDCKANAFLNVKVSVGGRAAWHQGAAETNIFGYMYPSGYLNHRDVFIDSPVSISYRWVSNSRLEVTIHNNTGDGSLIFAGTVTVSQNGYGF